SQLLQLGKVTTKLSPGPSQVKYNQAGTNTFDSPLRLGQLFLSLPATLEDHVQLSYNPKRATQAKQCISEHDISPLIEFSPATVPVAATTPTELAQQHQQLETTNRSLTIPLLEEQPQDQYHCSTPQSPACSLHS